MQATTVERPVAWHRAPGLSPPVAAPIEQGGTSIERRTVRPVLIVDDDSAIRAMVREALRDEGVSVVEAADGAEALAAIAAAEPCLILLDMRMPGMDGWSFARSYRAHASRPAPIVVITAARDAQGWADEIEADGVLAKPFELPELLEVVERYC